MRYKITHTTKYEYTDTVPFCQNIVFLTPRSTPRQTVSRHRLNVSPTPATNQRRIDYFGNTSHFLSVNAGHRLLRITASSTVDIKETGGTPSLSSAPWEAVVESLVKDRTREGLGAYQYAFRSPLVPFRAEIVDYARESFPAGRPLHEAVIELNARIHHDFVYDPTATTVSTPISEVFEKRRGVCQDLAHVMLGCLRPLGLAARYVSGYLRTIPPAGRERLVGADASHAWIAVYLGNRRWLDLDPTNNLLPTHDHITVAWGRDFGDVCPVSGMFVGGGSQILSVSVDVAPTSDLSTPEAS